MSPSTSTQIAAGGPENANQYLNSLLTAIPFGLSSASNGSLSDSGISDGGASGSDYGLSERERRLSALRRLARQLENALAPGSAALLSIAQRMEAAETDLRSLQDTCRQLIVRTAATQMQQKQEHQQQQQQLREQQQQQQQQDAEKQLLQQQPALDRDAATGDDDQDAAAAGSDEIDTALVAEKLRKSGKPKRSPQRYGTQTRAHSQIAPTPRTTSMRQTRVVARPSFRKESLAIYNSISFVGLAMNIN